MSYISDNKIQKNLTNITLLKNKVMRLNIKYIYF